MKFNVVRRATYTISDDEIRDFKKEMLEYYEEENLEEGEECPYTIDDIPDKIVEEVLAETLQCVFEDGDYYCSGINFDDYFECVRLDFYEEGVRDCVYEAVGNWITEMEETNMLTYNVGFINADNQQDETQLDVKKGITIEVVIEIINLILGLKDEMGIKEVTYIDFVKCEDEEDEE